VFANGLRAKKYCLKYRTVVKRQNVLERYQ